MVCRSGESIYFFSDIELKQIELEIRYNDLVLRKMIEEFE